ncbi:bifunctional cytidylyltransferase/SDR family oxidoreductase [Orlajensenia leifsoniae]|uniref:2-C-methyl-D-erythritol 4-phosphate cytidylyltransferase n=1 Tax=Orlajensenia leifsoniae TaxID=2561933 RepID=A0A4Y9QZ89_9MICO|nr:bifunctional cytidylyltransferase/SDR family oxidoreductase [Leifsonia flava]TFV96496.1 SDR family NAD(P)-dependent oxidoreductase [Leifsonia flava]
MTEVDPSHARQSETENLHTVAIILAGGVGSRVGLGIPKQLIKVAGKAIVEHTLETFDHHADVDEIIVMMNGGAIDELHDLATNHRFPKLSRILPGGATRNESSRLAIEALGEGECKVLFHDAVRPFVDDRIISDCVDALDTFEAVDTAIPSADTIIEVNDDHEIVAIPDRNLLRRGQTPQAFRLSTIREAYRRASDDDTFIASDDCGVVFRYLPGVTIHVVDGTAQNMKVTEPIDVHIADKIFQMQSSSLSHEMTQGRAQDLSGLRVVVFGGSYGIGRSVVELCSDAGAVVRSFSRSTTSTDVRSRDDIAKALSSASEEMGGIDAVVVTAGMLQMTSLVDTDDVDITMTMETNLLGPIMVAKESHRYLAETSGQLLLFTSSSYTRGRSGYSVYSSTKAGVVNLTQGLAEEWEGDGIRVNCINPQRTRTPLRHAAFGVEPDGTLLEPEEVGSAVTHVLAADATGQIVEIRVSDALLAR